MHVIWKCEQVYLIHGWLWSRALKDARWRDDTLHHVTISWTAQECRPTVGYSNSGFMSYGVITAHYTGWIDRGNECVKEGVCERRREKTAKGKRKCMYVCQTEREREQQKTSFLLLSLRLHYVCQSLSICACVPVCVFVCKVRYGNSAI